MALAPRLKPVFWERTDDDGVRIILDPREAIELGDDTGAVSTMLSLLVEGGRELPQLAAAVAEVHPEVSAEEVSSAVEALDTLRLLEDSSDGTELTPEEALRHLSNLAFLRTFSSLDNGRAEMLQRMRRAHVLVLGMGGLGSNVLQNLAGLGVGRLTLVDKDVVELPNFARQFIYRWSDLGRPKVERAAEWVRDFDPNICVETRNVELGSVQDVLDVLRWAKPSVVVSGVDSPRAIDTWVNEACVRESVPYVRGGMSVSELLLWSVVPGASACYACNRDGNPGDQPRSRFDALHSSAVPRVNRGIGPVATLLGGLVSMEVVRLLTGFIDPAYSGGLGVVDVGTSTIDVSLGERNPRCGVCGVLAPPATVG